MNRIRHVGRRHWGSWAARVVRSRGTPLLAGDSKYGVQYYAKPQLSIKAALWPQEKHATLLYRCLLNQDVGYVVHPLIPHKLNILYGVHLCRAAIPERLSTLQYSTTRISFPRWQTKFDPALAKLKRASVPLNSLKCHTWRIVDQLVVNW